jgi:hypothetical protein
MTKKKMIQEEVRYKCSCCNKLLSKRNHDNHRKKLINDRIHEENLRNERMRRRAVSVSDVEDNFESGLFEEPESHDQLQVCISDAVSELQSDMKMLDNEELKEMEANIQNQSLLMDEPIEIRNAESFLSDLESNNQNQPDIMDDSIEIHNDPDSFDNDNTVESLEEEERREEARNEIDEENYFSDDEVDEKTKAIIIQSEYENIGMNNDEQIGNDVEPQQLAGRRKEAAVQEIQSKIDSEDCDKFKEEAGEAIRVHGHRNHWSKKSVGELLKDLNEISVKILGREIFPSSTHMIDKEFAEYWKSTLQVNTLCSKCGSSYEFSKAVEQKKCTYQSYIGNVKVECKNDLMVERSPNNFIPLKSFGRIPIEKSLSALLSNEDVLKNCLYGIEQTAYSSGTQLQDIYDGNFFQSNYKKECQQYLAGEIDYIPIYLALNCDGFCPFKYRSHSSWAFILSICNLPRGIRFKKELSILWSVNEPGEGGLEGILKVLVQELNTLQDGAFFQTPTGQRKYKIRLAMTCCDIPGSRKLLGFVGHGGTVACQFCKYKFPRQTSVNAKGKTVTLSTPDFSGLECLQHGSKCHADLKASAKKYRKARTNAEREEISKSTGFHDSRFLKLKNFDMINSQTIDGMHMFSLGIMKKILLMITDKDDSSVQSEYKLSKKQKERAQILINKARQTLPADLYKPSHTFMEHLKTAKAADFQTAIYIMAPILAKVGAHEKVVNVVQFLREIHSMAYAKIIDMEDLDSVKILCRDFFSAYQDTFGKTNVTMNTHLILHVPEMLRRFGPMSNYHLFGYERINGILSRIPTSRRKATMDVEMLKSYTSLIYSLSVSNIEDDLKALLMNQKLSAKMRNIPEMRPEIAIDQIFDRDNVSVGNEFMPHGSDFVGKLIECKLTEIDKAGIRETLGICINGDDYECFQSNSFLYGDGLYHSEDSSSKNGRLVGTKFSISEEMTPYITEIKSFLKLTVENEIFRLMRVTYYSRTQKNRFSNLDGFLIMFDPSRRAADSNNRIIPINRISCRYCLIDTGSAVVLDRKLRL